MPIPSTRTGVKRHYDSCSSSVREYFKHLPGLLADYPLDVCISYAFSQVELAHNMTLYCGVVKKHRVDRTLARSIIDAHHMTRTEFRIRFEVVFGAAILASVISYIEQAENIRDKIMHGKNTLEREKREALYNVLTYAEDFNEEIFSLAGFRPFGNLVGFKGRAKSLDKNTTRWVLKGMGFNVM